MPKNTGRSCLNFGLLLFCAICISLGACVSSKKVIYLNDLKSDTLNPGPITLKESTKFTDPRIESNDVLAITVQTTGQSEGSNTPITTNAPGSFDVLNGYLVDKDGYIELPLIGFAKVGGLTSSEARELLKQKAKEFYRDPVVNVRIANFDVTVLGDIAKPGKVTIPSEKANLFDVLGMAGDLNISGKRKNVLLVRTEGGQQTATRVDLTSRYVYQSPYFWVKQRDMIYVEPSKYKVSSADTRVVRNLGLITTALSLVSLLFALKVVK